MKLRGLKEPAMSEFKVGDLVKMKDDSSTWMDRVSAIEYKPCFDSKWNKYEIEILVFEDGTKLGSGWAVHANEEVVPVCANVKFPYNVLTGEQVGAVMNATHFGCDLGDDFPIENHISPNCKAKDV